VVVLVLGGWFADLLLLLLLQQQQQQQQELGRETERARERQRDRSLCLVGLFAKQNCKRVVAKAEGRKKQQEEGGREVEGTQAEGDDGLAAAGGRRERDLWTAS
jgi:hypothetical protein